MERLTTSYLGLTLKSPVIVSSSRLTSAIENLEASEENGAGAVILKSLFEEQISYSINEIPSSSDYPEADDYIAGYVKSHSVDEYLSLIRNAKKRLSIPVIPSINCFSSKGWIDFSKKIEDAGADALEINTFFMPVDRKKSSSESEKIYFELVENLKAVISIPLVIKLGFRFSNVLYMIDQFYSRGVNGVVMFNRFYEPEIDVNKIEIVPASVFSTASEMRYVLRSVAMASAQGIKIDISASTGVKSGEDVIKYLLAGADTVQVCSILYQKGISYLKTINRQIDEWIVRNRFNNITDFRGKLNWKNTEKPVIFERTQFMKYFSSID